MKVTIHDVLLHKVGFETNNKKFELISKGMYFDYLYILGLTQNEDLANYVMEKDVFIDLMFKREKGIGCQVRSCALYKYLRTNGLVEQFISNPYEFNYI